MSESRALLEGKTTMTIGKAKCLQVTADSNNPSKDTTYNADVFGRVFDAAGENALDRDEASDAGRISNISEVPAGQGKVTFELTVSEQSFEAGQLKFKSFKAKSYPGAAFSGNSPLLGIEEENCDIYSDAACADRFLGIE